MASSLKTFLFKRELAPADADPGSHVSFGDVKKKWRVAPADEAALLELHDAALAEGPLSLCEMPRAEALPLIIDFDLVAAARPEGRLWGDGDMAFLGDFCAGLRDRYVEVCELEVDKLTLSAQQSLKSVMDLKRCQFIFTTNYLDRIDDGIINRSFLVEMNQSANASAYVLIGQSILQKMSLAATALPVAAITAMAHKAKGSLRTFASDVMIAGVKLGGVLPK
jgi:hypothetical protein